MKIALITTTINVPKVLALYRAYGPDVRFFVAFDKKTDPAAADFCAGLGSTEVLYDGGYACSEAIGWNRIQRRNIALLEALKWGAEIIVSIDDDNNPLSENYFAFFHNVLYCDHYYRGLKASSRTGWFDVGQLLQPIASHRGFPTSKIAEPTFEPITHAKVGVAAGLCLGDPDTSAMVRIHQHPICHGFSEVLRSGVVTDPRETWTVFNTQNTSFIRELAPAMFCPPGIGRYDDIVASVITQRVMRELGLHVHFGMPAIWQQRNAHDLDKDFREEMWGTQNLEKITSALAGMPSPLGDNPLTMVRVIYHELKRQRLLPDAATYAAEMFLDDVEKVL